MNGEAPVPPTATGSAPDVLAQAIDRIESIISQTPSDPMERTRQIQAVKDAYLQAVYNLTRPGGQHQ